MINVLCVNIGTALFLASLICFCRIYNFSMERIYKLWWLTLVIFILLFLVGYVAFTLALLKVFSFVDLETLVAQVFLWGAVFVLLLSAFFVQMMKGHVGFMNDLVKQQKEAAAIKQAKEELKKNEDIFRSFFYYSPVYLFIKDKDLRPLMLSKNFELMLGKPMKELLGKNMRELFPSDLAKSMVTDDLRILKEGKMITVEEELNGRSYSTIKFPILMDEKPYLLAGFTIDITERKQAEKNLAARMEELQTLYHATMDREDKILELKQKIEKLEKRP